MENKTQQTKYLLKNRQSSSQQKRPAYRWDAEVRALAKKVSKIIEKEERDVQGNRE